MRVIVLTYRSAFGASVDACERCQEGVVQLLDCHGLGYDKCEGKEHAGGCDLCRRGRPWWKLTDNAQLLAVRSSSPVRRKDYGQGRLSSEGTKGFPVAPVHAVTQ